MNHLQKADGEFPQDEEHGGEHYINSRPRSKARRQGALREREEEREPRRNTALAADAQECTRRQMKGC
jgi:hypothetical protein